MFAVSTSNPTRALDLSFGHFLKERQSTLAAHLVGGVPDYGFAMDLVLRQKIASMGPVRSLVQGMLAAVEPIQRQIRLLDGILVGPHQFPDIYALGEDCARRLGIGVPQIIIYGGMDEFNAYTFATNDVTPMVILTSSLAKNYSAPELKFIIGHECGHIHNLHSVYNTAVELLTNPAAKALVQQMAGSGLSLGAVQLAAGLIQGGLQLFMARWSRCAEITSDRAGLICCGDLTVAQMALAKLTTRGNAGRDGLNIDEYIKQISLTQATPLRFQEAFRTHPLIPRRLEALCLFAQSEIYHRWRPETPAPISLLDKEELERACGQVIALVGGAPQLGQAEN